IPNFQLPYLAIANAVQQRQVLFNEFLLNENTGKITRNLSKSTLGITIVAGNIYFCARSQQTDEGQTARVERAESACILSGALRRTVEGS
ncbi:hypothetical protein K0M31_020057, partial [Melipona bicolor]